METLQILQTIWFFLIGFLFVGYSMLDGFDLGIGTMLPFMAKNKSEETAIISTIGPVWDGNEVWIITAGGALFAAFPHVYATVFSGFYLALMLVLFALIFRAVSLEFWSMDAGRRHVWKWSFAVGSFLPALLFGVALGNLIAGIPLNDKMEFTGSFFTLLRPFPLSIGLLGLSAILLQGCAYGILKTGGGIQDRFRHAAKKIWIAFIFCLALSASLSAVYLPQQLNNPLCWIFTALILALQISYRVTIDTKHETLLFVFSSLSFACLWALIGTIQFPYLARATGGPEFSLSVYNASSTETTLWVMLIIALVGMPFVIGYTAYVYKIFRGKVNQ